RFGSTRQTHGRRGGGHRWRRHAHRRLWIHRLELGGLGRVGAVGHRHVDLEAAHGGEPFAALLAGVDVGHQVVPVGNDSDWRMDGYSRSARELPPVEMSISHSVEGRGINATTPAWPWAMTPTCTPRPVG